MSLTVTFTGRAVGRWLLGAVLLWAALGKLANVQEFYAALLAYQLPLPSPLLKATAVVLPWLELLCGLMLLANVRTTAALAWATVLFAVFAACTGQAWLRGLHIACGCLDLRVFGIDRGSALGEFLESVGFAFIRASVLAMAAGWLWRSVAKVGGEISGEATPGVG